MNTLLYFSIGFLVDMMSRFLIIKKDYPLMQHMFIMAFFPAVLLVVLGHLLLDIEL